MLSLPFPNRDAAARQLLPALAKFSGSKPVVLAIPRGAVPMGRIIADSLGGELDVVLVRKIGAPGNPEYAIGAVDEQGAVLLNEHAAWGGADNVYVQHEAQSQLQLIRERRARYRPGQPALDLAGRTVIVLDDGLATGSTMLAALKYARSQGPALLVCAVPVASPGSLLQVSTHADEVICLAAPRIFNAVGQFYQDFDAVSDAEVVDALAAPPSQSGELQATPLDAAQQAERYPVHIHAGLVVLEGDLMFPPVPRGLVIFAHGSGSSRHSPRNQYVATTLNQQGFATLLFDLLTPLEDHDQATRFDISLLSRRLEAALDFALHESSVRNLPIGLFGASTGAAAAINVAAARPGEVAAVVSRGGRPDLAGMQSLSTLRTHTLLIVGGADVQVLELNRAARAVMRDWAELVVVSGATHVFEEPGALEKAAAIAANWFSRWLKQPVANPA